ncbi:MAG: hypothetical protein ACYC7D_01485 [Nitrososphaerales archaeon]
MSSGFVYCVGGGGNGYVETDSVYFASIGSSGIGSWQSTNSYPQSVSFDSCVTDSGYIYCVGGGWNGAYFAPVSSSGVGSWTQTTNYPFPVSTQSCVTSSSIIVCV